MAFCSNCLSKWFNVLSSFLSLLFKLFPFLYVSLFWPLFHTNQNYLVLFIRDMLQRCLFQTTLLYVLLIHYVMFVTKRGIGQQDNLCLTQLVNNVRLIITARITGQYERQWKKTVDEKIPFSMMKINISLKYLPLGSMIFFIVDKSTSV